MSTGSASNESMKQKLLLVTGRKRGGVQVWDASAPSVQLLCTVNAQVNVPQTYNEITVDGCVYLMLRNTVNFFSLSCFSWSNVFDAACIKGYLLRIVFLQIKKGSAPVSAVVLNEQSGLLAYGDQEGKVPSSKHA